MAIEYCTVNTNIYIQIKLYLKGIVLSQSYWNLQVIVTVLINLEGVNVKHLILYSLYAWSKYNTLHNGIPADQNSSKWRYTTNVRHLTYWKSDFYWDISFPFKSNWNRYIEGFCMWSVFWQQFPLLCPNILTLNISKSKYPNTICWIITWIMKKKFNKPLNNIGYIWKAVLVKWYP